MSNIQIKHISWDLNKSFNISRGSKTTAETIEVKIESNNFMVMASVFLIKGMMKLLIA